MRFLRGRAWWEWLLLAFFVLTIASTIINEIQTEPFGFAVKIGVTVFIGVAILALFGGRNNS